MGKSIDGLLLYIKTLKRHFISRFENKFDLHEVFGEIISFQHLIYPSTTKNIHLLSCSETFINRMKKFHFFPTTDEGRLDLYTQLEVFQTVMVTLCTKAREENLHKSEIVFFLKSLQHYESKEV